MGLAKAGSGQALSSRTTAMLRSGVLNKHGCREKKEGKRKRTDCRAEGCLTAACYGTLWGVSRQRVRPLSSSIDYNFSPPVIVASHVKRFPSTLRRTM